MAASSPDFGANQRPPIDRVRDELERDPRIAYAVLFGSSATGAPSAWSDLDVAIGVTVTLDALDLGALASRLEAAGGRRVDLVLLDEAAPGLAYRVFRDGRVIVSRDRAALARRRARAMLEYLDFQPIEALFTRGVLVARDGR
jgi:predicted nucleotidyltransferase